MSTPTLHLDDDRLFPAEATRRDLARQIYEATRDLPIISPHGHVPIQWIAEDTPFSDPTNLLVTPDHYINRLLHANGVDLEILGVGQGELPEAAARAAFRTLCEHWSDFAGTAMRYWLVDQLVGIFGVTQRPSSETADEIYDQISEKLSDPSYRPQALLQRFGIEFMATTDDPCDDLAAHDRVREDTNVRARIAPTFRPDKYLDPTAPDWLHHLDRLAEVTGTDTHTWRGLANALAARRAYFKAHGAVSSDHGVTDLGTVILEPSQAERLFRAAHDGTATTSELRALQRALATDQARMAVEDGLTMTLHPGVSRNHDQQAYARYGADIGSDIPRGVEATEALRPLLNAYGNSALHLVVFSIDETVYGREIAPLAAWYPSVYIGVPWWFIDAPESILRFKRSITEMAGFSRTSGMIDDTRAFVSIPARHDMSRRLDAVHLAELVASHRLDLDEALEVAHRLVVDQPKKVFQL